MNFISFALVLHEYANLCVTPVYLILSLSAIVSPFISFLRVASSHGKTRIPPTLTTISISPLSGRSFDRRLSPNTSNLESWKGRFRLFFGCKFDFNHRFLLVSKRRFRDFYVVGLFISPFLWFISTKYNPFPYCQKSHDAFFMVDPAVGLLLMIHLLRRWYECVRVHAWSATSQMHVLGYILGVTHYSMLPLVFEGDLYHQCVGMIRVQWGLVKWMGFVLGLAGQMMQHVHHKILGDLRRRDPSFLIVPGRKDGKKCDDRQYKIPRGGWFCWVSCPHYTAEIAIYVSFAILLHPPFIETLTHGCSTYAIDFAERILGVKAHNRWDIVFPLFVTLIRMEQFKHLALLVWVITNLTVSATTSHAWYHQKFAGVYPSERLRIIPFIY